MLIQFNHVLVRRGEVTALSGITLTLSERRIGVIGPNGAGKSTLARLVNGLVLPTEGQVLVDGIDTRGDLAAIRRNVGFVFQNPDNQIVFPEVAEDIAGPFGGNGRGVSFSTNPVKAAAPSTPPTRETKPAAPVNFNPPTPQPASAPTPPPTPRDPAPRSPPRPTRRSPSPN